MNLSTDSPVGLRRAALTLHAVAAVDRDWLMQRLPQPNQEALAGLLAELHELGIARDAQVIRSALKEAPAAVSISPDQARALCFALAQQAPVLQSLLLATLNEGERDCVLSQWPYEVLARPSAVAEPAWTPALRDALLQSWREVASAQGADS